jgi:hypothetical protein
LWQEFTLECIMGLVCIMRTGLIERLSEVSLFGRQ